MERTPTSLEQRSLTVREEILWTLVGLALLAAFVVLLVEDQP